MRISDWSSDVCSSDLILYLKRSFLCSSRFLIESFRLTSTEQFRRRSGLRFKAKTAIAQSLLCLRTWTRLERAVRSEEHTSELQSLMRISYAVFCLKKKKTKQQITHRTTLTPM